VALSGSPTHICTGDPVCATECPPLPSSGLRLSGGSDGCAEAHVGSRDAHAE